MQTDFHQQPQRKFFINIRTVSVVGFFLTFSLSSFTSHTIVPIPPTILLFFISLFCYGAIIYTKRLLTYPVLKLTFISIAFYFFLTQTLLEAPFSRSFGAYIGLLYFIVSLEFLSGLKSRDIIHLGNLFIKLSLLLLIIEAIWRLTHPAAEYQIFEGTGDLRWIYQYKFSGLMYNDSNGTAIHLCILYFFILYWSKKTNQSLKYIKLITLLLIIFTFSRAGWVATFIGIIYLKYFYRKNISRIVIATIFIGMFTFIVLQFYLLPKLESDLSFQSKFHIFKMTTDYISNVNIYQFLFGTGFSLSPEVIGRYPHNFAMVIFVEAGLLGLCSMLIILWTFYKYSQGTGLYVLVPFIIITLSSTITFIPYFYCIFAVIIFLEHENIKLT